ncbi:MAG: collagen-like protein [Cytophagaceae bacterium]|nr:collagen-like protein [Cytophagaceae bacterium]MBK9934278.1 collagen-like protein [Cytophagaceae bacterium]MBL0300729.1 collagen-like protein [Cytophagaceae bacterium]
MIGIKSLYHFKPFFFTQTNSAELRIKIMKKLRFFSAILLTIFVGISLTFTSCEGPAGADGAVGPAGPAGPQGPTGATGAAGQNFTVTQFTFANRTWANTVGNQQNFAFTNVTGQTLASSAIVTYLGIANPNGADFNWFLVPGLVKAGPTDFGQYNTWVNVNPAMATGNLLAIRRESLGTSGAFTAPVRVIIIPANDLRNGRKAPVDFSDYNAVKAYYNLKD